MILDVGNHFDSIESAHDYVGLLSETVNEVKKEVDTDIEKALDAQSARRLEALRLVSYNLEKLSQHMKQSCRILNDLRSFRRLLFDERAPISAGKPCAAANVDLPAPPVRPSNVPVPPRGATPPATVVSSTHRAPGGISAA